VAISSNKALMECVVSDGHATDAIRRRRHRPPGHSSSWPAATQVPAPTPPSAQCFSSRLSVHRVVHGLGWVGSGHTKWTRGQLCLCTRYRSDGVLRRARRCVSVVCPSASISPELHVRSSPVFTARCYAISLNFSPPGCCEAASRQAICSAAVSYV